MAVRTTTRPRTKREVARDVAPILAAILDDYDRFLAAAASRGSEVQS